MTASTDLNKGRMPSPSSRQTPLPPTMEVILESLGGFAHPYAEAYRNPLPADELGGVIDDDHRQAVRDALLAARLLDLAAACEAANPDPTDAGAAEGVRDFVAAYGSNATMMEDAFDPILGPESALEGWGCGSSS